jgi:hypothetical protein
MRRIVGGRIPFTGGEPSRFPVTECRTAASGMVLLTLALAPAD